MHSTSQTGSEQNQTQLVQDTPGYDNQSTLTSYSRGKMKTSNSYGIRVKERTQPVKPVAIPLANEDGSRLVKTAAKRVISRHKKVIKALADR
jgi:hypothetical protein